MKLCQQKGQRVLAALADRLRRLLGEVEGLAGYEVRPASAARDRGFDLVAAVSLPGGRKARLYVECKSEPRPSLFPLSTAKQLPKDAGAGRAVPVLAAPLISSRLAELCRQHGWSWYDLAGNCRLVVPGAIQIERTGLAPVYRRPPPRANLRTAHAARVIRVLLALENAGSQWTQLGLMHHIASALPQSPVSIGLVNKVIRHLRDEAFIEVLESGKFRLRDPLGLLAAWKAAYRFDRHVRRRYFTLLQGRKLHEALAGLKSATGSTAAYMGFSAAAEQAPYVRQYRVWLYLAAECEPELRRVLEAKLVDSGDNVVVFLPDDLGVFYGQTGGPGRLPCTNLVQTYVDLFHCGGRGDDAAEALLDQKLKPEWKLRGLRRES